MEIHLDHRTCIGSGQCTLTAPTVFTQDDDGYAALVPDWAQTATRGRSPRPRCPAPSRPSPWGTTHLTPDGTTPATPGAEGSTVQTVEPSVLRSDHAPSRRRNAFSRQLPGSRARSCSGSPSASARSG